MMFGMYFNMFNMGGIMDMEIKVIEGVDKVIGFIVLRVFVFFVIVICI